MKKLILFMLMIAPSPVFADTEQTRQVFVDIDEVIALPSHQAECFKERAELCPHLFFKNGEALNPENAATAKECQIRTLEECKAI